MAKPSRLTSHRIDPTKVLRSVYDPGAGAVVVFLGTVRNTSEAGSVERMEYEAYGSMAEKRLALTEEEVMRRWPATTRVKIVHRVGGLQVGDVSVVVAVSSPHRGEAFEACRYAIETIKHEVPIWKREKLAGGRGEVWVEGNPLPARSSEAGSRVARRPRRRASGRT